jgi:hypothetical protein
MLVIPDGATWEQTGLILGHKRPQVLQLPYLSRKSGVDLQGLFQGRKARTDFVRAFRRLDVECDPNAPISHPKDTI